VQGLVRSGLDGERRACTAISAMGGGATSEVVCDDWGIDRRRRNFFSRTVIFTCQWHWWVISCAVGGQNRKK
jgi:hypothetical protein